MVSRDVQQYFTQEAYGKMPLAFVPNAGQLRSDVRFSTRRPGYGIYFTPDEAVFVFARGMTLALTFLGANPEVSIEGQCDGIEKVNYYIGNDPEQWHANLSTCQEVVYRELWPGVDLVFRGGNGKLKYEFVVKPAASVHQVSLACRGADDLSLDEAGNLQILTSFGVIVDERPVLYQEREGQQVTVTGSFVVEQDDKGAKRFGFTVGNDYDPRYPLIIDPALDYSTYLGGNDTDVGFGIAVDGAGSAYVTGSTESANFPVTPGAAQTALVGTREAFVTKLNAAGTALVYSTYLGGGGSNEGFAIAVDASGSTYVTGRTNADNFPTTPGVFQPAQIGDNDAFVTKLSPSGAFVYSTYLGGEDDDQGNGIAVDASGNAYVTGQTVSTDFPTTPGAFQTVAPGMINAFVTKLNPTATAPVYSTYLGGSEDDQGSGIAVDASGSAYVTGQTVSVNFPVTAGALQDKIGGVIDAFVTKLNPGGTAVVYSTYLGGSADDQGSGIAVDASGNAYVTGMTQSPNYPATTGAFQTAKNGFSDAFVAKINPNAAGPASLVYSTYLGGSASDEGFGVAVDAFGSAYATGRTVSTDFPRTAAAFQTALAGGADAFMTKLNPAGSGLVHSAFLGGTLNDTGRGIALDPSGNAYITGSTESFNFPITPGAFQIFKGGGLEDAFVAKIEPLLSPSPPVLPPLPIAITVTGAPPAPLQIPVSITTTIPTAPPEAGRIIRSINAAIADVRRAQRFLGIGNTRLAKENLAFAVIDETAALSGLVPLAARSRTRIYVVNANAAFPVRGPSTAPLFTLSVIDGATNAVVANLQSTAFEEGDLAVNPITNRIYVGSSVVRLSAPRLVTVINGARNNVETIIDTRDITTSRLAVNPVTNRIYTNGGAVIDGASNTFLTTGNIGSEVAVNPDTNRIYLTHPFPSTSIISSQTFNPFEKGNVSVIDGNNNAFVATVTLGRAPVIVAVNPNTNRVYVANTLSGNVSVIDGSSNNVTATITVGELPLGVAVNPDTNRIYVANNDGNTVSVIDGSTNNVIATITVGMNPGLVAVAQAINRIYVLNGRTFDGTPAIRDISVIDGSTNSVVATISGLQPISIAVLTSQVVNVESVRVETIVAQ